MQQRKVKIVATIGPASSSPEVLRDSPQTQPVKRLDEVRAVKAPVLVCPCDEPEGAK